jgi:hypothetical protein
VITDNEALLKFIDTKVLVRKRQIRWAEYLAAFNFKIEWRVGKKNPADVLLRRSDYKRPFLTGKEKRDNLLHELVTLRSKPLAESAQELDGNVTWLRAVSVAVLTRAQSMRKPLPQDSPWNTLSGPLITPEAEIAGSESGQRLPARVAESKDAGRKGASRKRGRPNRAGSSWAGQEGRACVHSQ